MHEILNLHCNHLNQDAKNYFIDKYQRELQEMYKGHLEYIDSPYDKDETPEEYIIVSEDPKLHWKYYDVKGKRVLDLGCGRADASSIEQTTPYYFNSQEAAFVVAVDSWEEDIEYFKKNLHNKDKFEFIYDRIHSADQIRDYIKRYKINSVKCDIEHMEKVLLEMTKEDFEGVDNIALEVHTHQLKDALIPKLKEFGFYVNVEAPHTACVFIQVLFCTRKKTSEQPAQIEIELPKSTKKVSSDLEEFSYML